MSPSESDRRVPGVMALTDDAAVDELVARIGESGYYADRVPGACLSYRVEDSTAAHVDIAVAEKHGGACAGDPATAPVLDRYRVDRSADALQRYDVAEDAYVQWPPQER